MIYSVIMRAIVFDAILEYRRDYPKPVPLEGEALIKVSLAGICATDLEITKGYMGFKGVLGHEFVGVIEETADDRFQGKRVVGEINIPCGKCEYCKAKMPTHCPVRSVLGIHNKDGAFADYVTLPLKNLHPLPDDTSDEAAVFTEPLAAAFEIFEQVPIDSETKVAVLGDGRLGLLVSEVMNYAGCNCITIGRHAEKLDILKKMNIPARLGKDGFGRVFDVVVDCTGSASGFDDALALVKPLGTVVLKTTVAGRGSADLNRVVVDEITVVGSRCGPFRPALKALDERKVRVKPLISKVFPIEEGLKAMEYAGEKGVLKVLIKMD